MTRTRINYPLAATLLASNVTLAEAAQQAGAKNGNVLRVGLKRHGVTAREIRSLPIHRERIQSAAIQVAAQASQILREKMAAEIGESVDMLGRIPKAATLKHLKRRVEVIEPLARTAKIVHGWSDSGVSALIQAGDMDCIDVEVMPSTPQPFALCGVLSETSAQSL